MQPIWNRNLIRAIRDQFKIDWHGYHGIWHWQNVRRNAHHINRSLKVFGGEGADPVVLDLFALFHDACRLNENTDPLHGFRGAALAEQMRGTHFDCTDEQMAKLKQACEWHNQGDTSQDVTIGTCWDADRLDLPRVCIEPAERFFSHPLQSFHGHARLRGEGGSSLIERKIFAHRKNNR